MFLPKQIRLFDQTSNGWVGKPHMYCGAMVGPLRTAIQDGLMAILLK